MATSPSEVVEGKEQSRQAEMVRVGWEGEGENGNELLILFLLLFSLNQFTCPSCI